MHSFQLKSVCCLFLPLLFASCDFAVPEKVQVKASPSVSFSTGKSDIKLASYLTLEDIKKHLGSDANMSVYNYIPDPGDKTMQYVVEYPIVKNERIPLNIDELMKQLEFEDKLNQSIPKKTFSVPDISINREIASVGLPVPEGYDNRLPGISVPGVTTQQEKALAEQTVPLNITGTGNVQFQSAVIKNDGNSFLTLTILSPKLASWTNTTKEIHLNITQENGLNLPVEKTFNPTDAMVVKVPLGGQTITTGDLQVSGNFNLVMENATVVIPDGTDTISIHAEMTISKLDSVTLLMDDSFNQSLNPAPVSIAVPADMKKWIDSITFNNIGVDLTLDNGLPDGNDISVTLLSEAFGIENCRHDFPGNSTDTKNEYRSNTANYQLHPADYDTFEIELELGLTGYNPDTKQLTLHNIVPGTELSFEGSATGVFDYSKIAVKANQSYTGSYPENGQSPLDLSGLKKQLVDNLGLKSVPVYMYLSAPVLAELDAFKNQGSKITGLVSATYTENGNSKTEYFVKDPSDETESKAADIKFAEVPDFSALTTDETVYNAPYFGNDLNSIDNSLPGNDIDLAPIINASPANLSFYYDFNIGTINLTDGDIATLKEISGDDLCLSATLVIVLPLKLEATEKAILDLNTLAEIETNKDLLGRNSATNITDEIQSVLDGLKTMSLTIDYNNYLFTSETETGEAITATLTHGTGFEKSFVLENGVSSSVITVTSEDVKHILHSYPFYPDIALEIPKNVYRIERDAGMDMSVTVNCTTNITYTMSTTSQKGGN